MESNDELKEINIKIRTCYYFDNIIKIEDFDLDVQNFNWLTYSVQNSKNCNANVKRKELDIHFAYKKKDNV